ncbi:MAG: NADH-quinone oxidoreductase subunit NuoF, partial [Actinomycetota bacterium]
LRGRGGAGFPTGGKWGFIPRDTGLPVYLVVNGDEGEPGTFKDRELIERDPHQLIEGILISAYAIGAARAFVYLRGEMALAGRRLEAALAEAGGAGYLGARVMGRDFGLEILVHRGSGAYICGEETALLESLEGFRGQPRLRPPFPAVKGLYASPTAINNVETICAIPHVIERGVAWFRSLGTERSPGPKIFSISGEINRPGNYEAALGIPARVLIEDFAGGVWKSKQLKAFAPGGSSTPLLSAEHLDVRMDFESVAAAGSQLGTGAMIVIAEGTCIVRAVRRFTDFYAHESCGKCTPCREGTYWMRHTLARIEEGRGRAADVDTLLDVCSQMFGRCFCPLGDGAVSPVESSIRLFREDYERHIREGACPWPGRASLPGAG